LLNAKGGRVRLIMQAAKADSHGNAACLMRYFMKATPAIFA
jgi:hypothetical protein